MKATLVITNDIEGTVCTNGKILKQENTIREKDTINISELGIGIYFIQFWDATNQLVGNKKLITY